MQPTDLTSIVTDLLLAAFSFWLAFQLLPIVRRLREHAISYWCAAFCSVASSALLGGIWHGFAPARSGPCCALMLHDLLATGATGTTC